MPIIESLSEPGSPGAIKATTEAAPVDTVISSRGVGYDALREAGPRPFRPGPFRRPRGLRDDTGAATAEYAVATMAAVGFAGLLIVILRGDEVRGILTDLVRNALSVG
ncbi:DUF4244 domain-containing protein [Cryobacterium breve]|uniref:DUF4244 domain-containing protein n=1 Tax=Cryobacterium breve TaxID=1259258 RepID=A0ABY2J7R2_9MICO|nr:DUF4244 domain-containing protein [Cryobacterium sp. TmT3-12]TFD00866.1 DUF4244 domain-containing protein [Cryobacterium breve]